MAVPTTLSVTGNYSQITSFISGLDNFPRLFVIQTFNLTFGQSGTGPGSGSSASASGTASAPSSGQAPLWVGGTATSPSASPYNLAIVGSIYYTSTPNALDACTKATTSIH